MKNSNNDNLQDTDNRDGSIDILKIGEETFIKWGEDVSTAIGEAPFTKTGEEATSIEVTVKQVKKLVLNKNRGSYFTVTLGNQTEKSPVRYQTTQNGQNVISWNQTFSLLYDPDDGKKQHVIISVFERHLIHADFLLGELMCAMKEVDSSPVKEGFFPLNLKNSSNGEIHVKIVNKKLLYTEKRDKEAVRSSILKAPIISHEDPPLIQYNKIFPQNGIFKTNEDFLNFQVVKNENKKYFNFSPNSVYKEPTEKNSKKVFQEKGFYIGQERQKVKPQLNQTQTNLAAVQPNSEKQNDKIENENQKDLENTSFDIKNIEANELISEDFEIIEYSSPDNFEFVTAKTNYSQVEEKSENSEDSDENEETLSSSTHVTDTDWNGRFQAIMEEIRSLTPNTKNDKQITCYSHLIHLAQDFLFSARNYGKRIISEAYLPLGERSIKPTSSGGILGGAKYVVNNILFKFSGEADFALGLTEDDLFKIAGHELKGASSYFDCGIKSLCTPLLCLVDYLGFRLIAISILPIEQNTTLVYGSADAGTTIHSDSSDFNELMYEAAHILNLKPHYCGLHNKLVFSACDLEGHIGFDNKKYLLDFSRVMPPDLPEKNSNQHLYRLLRPEFVKKFPVPLCPDTFSGFVKYQQTEAQQHIQEIKDAHQELVKVVIPKFTEDMLASLLKTLKGDQDTETSNYYYTLSTFRVTESCHKEGINLRYLGQILKHLKKLEGQLKDSVVQLGSDIYQTLQVIRDFKSLVFTEMIARCLKSNLRVYLRQNMKVLSSHSSGNGSVTVTETLNSCRYLVCNFLNLVFGDTKDSKQYWDQNLKKNISIKFPNSLTPEDLGDDVLNLKDYIVFSDLEVNGVKQLFFRLKKLTGLKLDDSFEQELETSSDIWFSKEPFKPTYIDELCERVKYMTLIEEALGFVFMNKAKKLLQKLHSRHSLSEKIDSSSDEKIPAPGLRNSGNLSPNLGFFTPLFGTLSINSPERHRKIENSQQFNKNKKISGEILLNMNLTVQQYLKRAIEKFEDVLDQNSNNRNVLVHLAWCLQKLQASDGNNPKDFSQSVLIRIHSYLQRALAVNPNDTMVLTANADFLQFLEKYNESEKYYLKALSSDPNNVQCLENYALLLQNNFSENDVAQKFRNRLKQVYIMEKTVQILHKNAENLTNFENPGQPNLQEISKREHKKYLLNERKILKDRITELNCRHSIQIQELEVTKGEDNLLHAIIVTQKIWENSVSNHVHQTPEILRTKINDWIVNNRTFTLDNGKTLEDYAKPLSWEDYCKNIKNQDIPFWCDYLILVAISNSFGLKIIIISSENKLNFGYCFEISPKDKGISPVILLSNYGKLYFNYLFVNL